MVPFGLATNSQRRFVDIIRDRAWREDLEFILTGDDVTRGNLTHKSIRWLQID